MDCEHRYIQAVVALGEPGRWLCVDCGQEVKPSQKRMDCEHRYIHTVVTLGEPKPTYWPCADCGHRVTAPEMTAQRLPRCATCRWAEEAWDKHAERSPLTERYPLACQRASMSDGIPDVPQTLAFTMDGSSYRGELLVTPDFGCVMWEGK